VCARTVHTEQLLNELRPARGRLVASNLLMARSAVPHTFEELSPTADDRPAPSPSLNKERVLVVEDSRTIASVLKHFLELEGFAVLLAADGLTGLEVARRERPHVIVTDVNMPGMDGLAMVKALRADPLTRDIAISMLTSETRPESEAKARAGGADDYMLKSIDPRLIAARVKALLVRSTQRPPAAVSS
jgi:CheY-like chemotaxis protein